MECLIALCEVCTTAVWPPLGGIPVLAVLGQPTGLNFRISCMEPPVECWRVTGGSVGQVPVLEEYNDMYWPGN